MPAEILAADLVWTAAGFLPDLQVRINEHGKIVEVGRLGLAPTRRLARRALLPGMVNAHSHAFQRGLRGRGETFPAGAGSFWTWREAMYQLVLELTPERFYALCVQAFREMLSCGITTVGEFHYFHHAEDHDYAFDELVLQAAREVGIRLVLLQAFYQQGGIGQPLAPAQRRFRSDSVDRFFAQLDHLQSRLDPRTQSLGVVVHSVRAATLEDLVAVHRGALERGLVFHIHIEEQPQEIADALAAYGRRPLALLSERLAVSGSLTAVHCTHSLPEDLQRFFAAGGNICLCPLTEANLGDGLADLATMIQASAQLALGTDSNARIAMAEEMRWLEYGQRLGQQRRGICRDPSGEVGRQLFHFATRGGARALGLEAGEIQAGAWADFLTLDLEATSLAGFDPATLLDAWICGGTDSVVREVCVGGCWQSW